VEKEGKDVQDEDIFVVTESSPSHGAGQINLSIIIIKDEEIFVELFFPFQINYSALVSSIFVSH